MYNILPIALILFLITGYSFSQSVLLKDIDESIVLNQYTTVQQTNYNTLINLSVETLHITDVTMLSSNASSNTTIRRISITEDLINHLNNLTPNVKNGIESVIINTQNGATISSNNLSFLSSFPNIQFVVFRCFENCQNIYNINISSILNQNSQINFVFQNITAQ